MRTLHLIIIILTGQLILACSGKKEIEVTEVTDITIEETEIAPEPPPPSFSCLNAVTLSEWFFKLCDTEKPGKGTIAYKFGFFETDKCYAVFLIDSKDHEMPVRTSAMKNEDEWAIEYYSVSKNEYKDLDWQQVMNKMRSQIKEFINTEKFKNSSFAKEKSITIFFDDGNKLRLK